MKRLALVATAGVLTLAACSDQSDTPMEPQFDAARGPASVTVTSNADAGTGSFRAALESANSDRSIRSIRFSKNVGTIALIAPLTFTGAQPLEIDGASSTIDGGALGARQSILTADGGGDLAIAGLKLKNAPGSGLVLKVPEAATGIQEVRLDRLTVTGNGLHGIIINDQTAYFEEPLSEAEAGSTASLRVVVTGSQIRDNGFAEIDQDGLRINEGGEGDLTALISGTDVIGNGGDGVELDERANGSALFTVLTSHLDENGAFDASDFDDGIDVDEAGAGGISGSFWSVTASRNFEQGIDLNENGVGNMTIVILGVTANDNREEGVELEEDDDVAGGGDIEALFTNVTTLRNGADDGDAGLKLREKGDGNLKGHIIGAVASDNNFDGIVMREDAEGSMDIDVTAAVTQRNAGDGIAFDENGNGNLKAGVLLSRSTDNEHAGIHAEQATAGTGTLKVRALKGSGNGDENVEVDGVVADVR